MKRNLILSSTLLLTCTLLSQCSSPGVQDGAPSANINVNLIPNAKPRPLAKSRYGNPASYVINGKRYHVLSTSKGYSKTGIASWYGTKFHGRLTSTREPYNMYAMTAASPNLPIPCFVRVTNLKNNREIIVKVNDRGPFASNRIIDLSWAAATKLGFTRQGTALVQVTALDVPHAHHPSQPSPKLFIQIGAFFNPVNADHLKQRAQAALTEPVHIKTLNHNNNTLYRVQVGPISTVKESDDVLHHLTLAGYHNAFSIVD